MVGRTRSRGEETREPTPAAGADGVAAIDDRDDNSRLLALSDGVFAIALTILVLDIRVSPGVADLAGAVGGLWPKFVSYAISFIVIGIFWMAHHRIFRAIDTHDTVLLWLNTIFLLLIGFLPFPVSLLGEYDDRQFAIVFYDGAMIAVSFALLSISFYALRHPRLYRRGVPAEDARFGIIRGLVVPIVMAISIALSFVDLTLAQNAWFLIVAGHALLGRLRPSPV